MDYASATHPPLDGRTGMDRGRIEDDVRIELSDGTRLSARIWFPEGSGPWPAILEYHPYPKRYTTARRDEIAHGYFAQMGYVAIRVDMRGSGDSEGAMSDEYTDQERRDALDIIEWVAGQAWSSGALGMYGLSWGGFNSLQLAAIAPDPLKAVAVAGATDDRYREDVHFMGGVMASEHIGWAAALLSFLTRPPDPAIAGRRWKGLWRRRLETLDWVLPSWLEHPARDSFWTSGFPTAAPEGLRVPALVAAGTADVFAASVLRMVARQPDLVKGIIGPWVHRFPHEGLPAPAVDWMNQCTRWFDRWLKGEPNGVEKDPRLRVFVSGSHGPCEYAGAERPGGWYALQQIPGENTDHKEMRLGRDHTLGSDRASGKVTVSTPQTLGLASGEIMPMGWGADLPDDQSADDALSVCFETGPLERSMVVIGQPVLTLRLARDSRDAFLVARLCDVAPDGSSVRVGLGARNLALDASFERCHSFTPGQAQSVRLVFGAVAHRFPKGHRIRLALSNTCWPMLWPSSGVNTLELHLAQSSLSLPVLPPGARAWYGFGAPDGSTPLPRTILEPARFDRTVCRDRDRGRTKFVITDTAQRERSDAHGLETWGETARTYVVDDNDPAAASMHVERSLSVGRGPWQTSTRVEVTFRGTRNHFLWDVTLVARHSRRNVARRRFSGEIPRWPAGAAD